MDLARFRAAPSCPEWKADPADLAASAKNVQGFPQAPDHTRCFLLLQPYNEVTIFVRDQPDRRLEPGCIHL